MKRGKMDELTELVLQAIEDCTERFGRRISYAEMLAELKYSPQRLIYDRVMRLHKAGLIQIQSGHRYWIGPVVKQEVYYGA